MAYSKDTRQMVLNYLANGHTYEEARDELGVGISTMKDWKRLLNETGSLEMRSKRRSASRFHDDELRAYIKEHPDATLAGASCCLRKPLRQHEATFLEDIAEHFKGSISGAHDAPARVGITLKKRALFHREG
jgi:transposase